MGRDLQGWTKELTCRGSAVAGRNSVPYEQNDGCMQKASFDRMREFAVIAWWSLHDTGGACSVEQASPNPTKPLTIYRTIMVDHTGRFRF
jgi:hypothetical protein